MTPGCFLLSSAAAVALSCAAAQPAIANAGLLDVQSCNATTPASQGITFCEVTVGSGEEATTGDTVEVDYTARAMATGGVVNYCPSPMKHCITALIQVYTWMPTLCPHHDDHST